VALGEGGFGGVNGGWGINGPDAEHGEGKGDDEHGDGDDEGGGLELLTVEETEGAENDGEGDEKADDAGGEDEGVEDREATIAMGLLDEGEGLERDDGEDAGHKVEDVSADEGEEKDEADGELFVVVGFVVALLDEGNLFGGGEELNGATGGVGID
jgi:hypothetical protein